MIQELAQKYGMNYFECSAKTGMCVKEAIESLTKEAMIKFSNKHQQNKPKDVKTIGPSQDINPKQKKG